MLGPGLALFSAVSFGVADFIGGSASRRNALLVVLAVAQATGLVAIGALVAARGDGPPGARFLALAVLAGVVGTIGLAALYRGLAVGSMSVVAPIAGTAAVIPVVAGVAIGEKPSALQNAGIALALVGVVLASRTPAAPDRAGRVAPGVGLAVLAAVTIGVFLVVLDAASEGDPYWASLTQRSTSAAILWTAVLALRRPLGISGQDRALLPVVGILDVAGNTLFAVATTKGLIGVVSVLASLYPVVTVALARLLHDERMSPPQAVGVAAAFAGVALITLG